MADVTLQVHFITNGLSGGGLYETGQYIRVIADGASIRAELWTASDGGSFIATPSGGPNIDGGFNQITVSSGAFNNAKYCDGEDLVSYSSKLSWPYANYHLTEDHPSCAIVVCDLEITSATPTNETGVGQADGEVALTATSSNGTIKYSLTENFDYASGQDSPITGLTTGNYTVYAKDAAGCQDSITVFVGQDVNYGPRWRMDYDVVFPRGVVSRIDIEELEYTGSVTEICGGAEPFNLEYHPSDDSQVVPSSAVVQILCETDAQFDDIRTGQDRQFRVRKYKGVDFDNLSLEWTGFISPEFYSEPYLNEPYYIELTAYDGLGELKNKDFKALSGEEFFGDMSLIKIISECLKKLPLEINIRSCVNIFEQGMNTAATDDPLAQTYIASQNFRENNCDEVLTSILKPFTRAEIFQSFGVWWIRTKEQSVYSTLPYREFDVDGEYVDEDSISSRKKLDFPHTSNRLCFIEAGQVLSYSRNYGLFRIVHELGKDNNMIDSGGFEDKDLVNGGFRGWNIFPAQVNVTYGQEKVENGDSRGAFFFQWVGTSGNQADNILTSTPLPLSFPDFHSFATRFTLKFQVYVSLAYPVKWVRLGVRLRWVRTSGSVGDFYDSNLNTNKTIHNAVNTVHVEDIYITSFNSWQTLEFQGLPPGIQTQGDCTVSVSFFFHNHTGRDFASFTTLRAATTLNTLPEGKRVYATDGGDAPTYGYELRRNTETESAPDIIRPDDYNAASNPRQWVKIDELNIAGSVAMVDRIMIDNVEIKIFGVGIIPGQPGIVLIDPPETVTYETEVTKNNESVFEDEVMNGDAPDLLGTEYIYNGLFKLSDGTPTALWARSGVTESARLLDIYLSHLVAQGSSSLRLLSGTGIADIQLGYINSLEDQRDNRRYRFTRFALSDKAGRYSFELEETLTGDDGESPPDAGEFEFTTEFSEEFTA